MNEIPKAKARFGFKRVVVEECPYCHQEHTHSSPADNGEKRMADCLLGEYILEFEF